VGPASSRPALERVIPTSDPVRPGWRLRAIRRKMSFETFERTIPFRPGWKREYYDGVARVRPGWSYVRFLLPLAPRHAPRVVGLRRPTDADAGFITDAFLDAFRFAPEYAEYPIAAYRKKATAYVAGYFGDVRGEPSPASVVVVRRGRVLAAALVKERPDRRPLLDCVFVRPEAFRRGLATAVATIAVNRLAEAGHAELSSGAMLANEPSLAWHAAFGFRERAGYFVAQSRWANALHERERLEGLGRLTRADDARLTAAAERWGAEAERLYDLPFAERHPGRDD